MVKVLYIYGKNNSCETYLLLNYGNIKKGVAHLWELHTVNLLFPPNVLMLKSTSRCWCWCWCWCPAGGPQPCRVRLPPGRLPATPITSSFSAKGENLQLSVCVCVCVCMCVNMNCKNLNGKPTKTFSLSLAIHFFSPLPLVFPSQGGTGNTSENQMEIGYSHEKFQGL